VETGLVGWNKGVSGTRASDEEHLASRGVLPSCIYPQASKLNGIQASGTPPGASNCSWHMPSNTLMPVCLPVPPCLPWSNHPLQVERTINGTPMYMYEITSDRRTYLSTIGKKGDTIFALVVTAPHNAFEQDAADLRHIQDTFKLL